MSRSIKFKAWDKIKKGIFDVETIWFDEGIVMLNDGKYTSWNRQRGEYELLVEVDGKVLDSNNLLK